MKKIFVIIMSLFVVDALYAGSVTGAKITSLQINSSSASELLIMVDGTKADCQMTGGWAFLLDVSTDLGRQMMAMALTAHSTGSPVQLYGFVPPLCGSSNIEKLNIIRLD